MNILVLTSTEMYEFLGVEPLGQKINKTLTLLFK